MCSLCMYVLLRETVLHLVGSIIASSHVVITRTVLYKDPPGEGHKRDPGRTRRIRRHQALVGDLHHSEPLSLGAA